MQIDTERQQEARKYHRLRRRLSLGSTTLLALGTILFVLFRGDKWLRDVLQSSGSWLNWQPVSGWAPLLILLYFLMLTVFLRLLTFPLTYYQSFILSHRYGLSKMSRPAWVADYLKSTLLGLIFQAVIISLIYMLLALQPQTWWLWVGIGQLFFTVLLVNLAPILIFPLFYKFTPLSDGDLKQRLLALAQKARTRVRGVYTMHLSSKTTAANAALMGLGNTRRIVLGDTMTDRYTPDEIEVVLAHELGHHVHHDIWRAIILDSVITLVALFLGSLILHQVIDVWHLYKGLADPATLPIFAILAGLYGFIILPLSNFNSRRAEYRADEYALQATGKSADFKSAMTRLANQNLAEVEPSPVIEFLFHSHPSIAHRLQHADDFEKMRAKG
jgi:STE24 endopeptidase